MSAKRDLEDTVALLEKASKRVRCSPFLPTTESDNYGDREYDSYRERDFQKAKDKERDCEQENKLQKDRD